MIEDLVHVEYSCFSYLDDGILSDPNDFVNKVFISVHEVDEVDDKISVIAKAEISLILLELADFYGSNETDVLDATHQIMEMAEALLGFGSDKYTFDILSDYYPEEIFFNYNILHLDSIKVRPKWRRRGIGKYIIKDILERYFGNCGVMTLKAFPLQLEHGSSASEEHAELKLNEFAQNEEKAKLSLFNYYKSLGFKNFNGDEYFIGLPYQVLNTINKLHKENKISEHVQ